MTNKLPSLEEKKNQIISSSEINSIAVKYLPDVYSDEYFFISYSHKDYKKVYCDLLELQANGLQIWYDRQMSAGKSWLDIARRYMTPFGCKGIIFYISENSLISKAVIEEIEFARKLNKPIITVVLPFEHDYIYQGKSVINSIYGANKMLDILSSNGVEIPEFEERKVKINKYFPDDVIYLPFDMVASKKVEQIRNNIEEIDVIDYIDTDDGMAHPLRYRNLIKVNDLSITKVDLEEEIKEDLYVKVGYGCFANSIYLESVNIPELLEVGGSAFANCERLESLSSSYSNEESTIFGLDIAGGAFYGCKKLKRITRLYDNDTNKTNVPTDLVRLESDYNFYLCESLETISIQGDVGSYAFAGCRSLTKVSFSVLDTPTNIIGVCAFTECNSLTNVDLSKVKKVDDEVFSYCENLIDIYLGGKLEELGFGVFSGCTSLKEVRLTNNIKHLGPHVFQQCTSLATVYWDIDVDYEVSSFDLFDDSGLRRVIFGDNVKVIPSFCFQFASKLEEVILPSSLTYIGQYAFRGCDSLKYNIYKGGEYLGNKDNPYFALISIVEEKEFEKHPDCVLCDASLEV